MNDERMISFANCSFIKHSNKLHGAYDEEDPV